MNNFFLYDVSRFSRFYRFKFSLVSCWYFSNRAYCSFPISWNSWELKFNDISNYLIAPYLLTIREKSFEQSLRPSTSVGLCSKDYSSILSSGFCSSSLKGIGANKEDTDELYWSYTDCNFFPEFNGYEEFLVGYEGEPSPIFRWGLMVGVSILLNIDICD